MATAEEILDECIATCARDAGERIKIAKFPGEITVTATELHLARRCAAAEARIQGVIKTCEEHKAEATRLREKAETEREALKKRVYKIRPAGDDYDGRTWKAEAEELARRLAAVEKFERDRARSGIERMRERAARAAETTGDVHWDHVLQTWRDAEAPAAIRSLPVEEDV